MGTPQKEVDTKQKRQKKKKQAAPEKKKPKHKKMSFSEATFKKIPQVSKCKLNHTNNS